jgi:hypothetical protein
MFVGVSTVSVLYPLLKEFYYPTKKVKIAVAGAG